MLAALAVLGAGCMAGMKKPEVRMEGVKLGGIGLTGGLVYVEVMVVNPNRQELAAQRLTYDFDIADPSQSGEWIDFAEGEYREEMRVGGRDSTLVRIPIEFSYRDAGRALRTVFDRGSLNYRVRGAVDVSKPLRTEVPFRKSGVVTLSGN